MSYIIDGHNLIAALPGIDLTDVDDEGALLTILKPFAQRIGQAMHVYFDQGQTGRVNALNLGKLHVHFSLPPRTADDAIRDHLHSIGKEGPNWVVVSSDHEIRKQAQQIGAKNLTSEAFSRVLFADGPESSDPEKPSEPLSSAEVEAWEALFKQRGDGI